MANNTICSVAKCCKPAKSRGWCNTHYERWRRNGGPTASAPTATILSRFSGKYEVSADGCWVWTAFKNASGYGKFGTGGSGRSEGAHRASYRLHKGPIPKGMSVCHKCDNPSCVNPDHLFLGTAQDNMEDRSRKNRTARGEKNGKSVITMAIAEYIRSSDLSERAIAKELGVHRGTVNAVRSGRTWKDTT